MPTLATTTELAAYLSLRGEYSDDTLLAGFLDSAEGFVESYTRRKFRPEPAFVNGVDSASPVTKTFPARGKVIVTIPDLRAVTSIALDGATLTENNGYAPLDFAEPVTAIQLIGSPWQLASSAYYGTGTLSVRGRWGWSPCPPEIKDTILALAARRYREKDAAWADSVATPEGGVLSYFRQLPASVEGVLKMYRKPHLAVI